MDSPKKFLNFYGIFVVLSWGLMFIIYNKMYSTEETIQGMTFICIAAAIFLFLSIYITKVKLDKLLFFGV
ncbi:hypothetical protein [Cytobacillus horneckiae]|uniref:Uncharacterized protein n=1 Tax=Cytobacillus horneckiae TaxID=549687 RepID=A0A2N0ZB49_9BACI|nr:hypothetical protein [Cytobacillus horneckiae]MEC1155538.1 hypothetical protein [Cytobacillus horneckiae]MED2936857.1 hypothetical protein [Cytobacillus horneckiae]PKG26724.1 hypothetical protein CWS20_22345 [Cytobacillus horneckiae]